MQLAERVKNQQSQSNYYTGSGGYGGQSQFGIMSFNQPMLMNNNSVIQEERSSQHDASSKLQNETLKSLYSQSSHRTTFKNMRDDPDPEINMGISPQMIQSSQSNKHLTLGQQSNPFVLDQKIKPLKSVSSAANRDFMPTPIVQSNHSKFYGDLEESKLQTEFAETNKDDDNDYEYEDSEDQKEDSQMDESDEEPQNYFQEYQELDNTVNPANQLALKQGYYVLFVDPEFYFKDDQVYFIYYRKDLKRDDYIVFEPFADEELCKKFSKDNEKHLYKIRKLLVIEGFSWYFKGEADLYRRRPFPVKFLENEASDYPCYVFQSELSKAFNHKGEIFTIVDLLEYKNQIQENIRRGNDMDGELVIKFSESLVTSTKEFIKNILRKIYEKFQVKIKARSKSYNLILKADGYREYFEGNYQLLQYERVRTCLRKNEPMKLILTEIPKNYRDRRFPPIFKMNYQVPPANHMNNQGGGVNYTSKENQQEEDEDDFNYNILQGSSPMFWYPPVYNLKNLMEKQAKQKINNTSMGPHQQQDKSLRKVVYVAPEKELVSLTVHRHLTGGTTIPKQNQQIILQSGECNWRFKFKLIGIERLNVIFNEIKQRVATDNMNTEPRNVTLKSTKIKKKQRINEFMQLATGGVVGNNNQKDAHHKNNNNSNEKEKKKGGGSKSIMGIFKSKKQRKGSEDMFDEEEAGGSAQNQGESSKKKKNEDEVFKQEDLPNLLRKTMKVFGGGKEKPEENKKLKKKKKKHKHGEGGIHIDEEEEKYLGEELSFIHTPYCNFSNKYDTILHYYNILGVFLGKMTPLKLQIECSLYHGCELLTSSQMSNEIYFNNTVHFDQWIQFGNLRYCQIPVKTRLSFNIIMITKEGQSLTIGCVSMNLFDEKGRFRNGMRELNVWPFYELDERLGCMKEYNGMTVQQAHAKDFQKTIDSLFTKLVVEFESFICPLYYSSRDEKKIDFFKLSTNKEDKEDKANLINVQIKNQDLAKLKRYLNQNPLTKIDESIKRDLFKCREHYQTHPQGLPIFLRSVQWNRPIQVNEVYKMLQNWAPMKPEEAISLLDAKFPDERVRQYAVQRISQLSDDDLALYMLQFAQALLYEEQHNSPLAEMLIERSLKNPYVVGHAFYWSLKSNLYLKVSYERYYVLLEQFLMLCGKFKEEIWIQQKVNMALRSVSEGVVRDRYKEKIPFGDVKENARKKLREERKKLPFLFTLTIDPKIVIKDFKYEKLTVFGSKKVPLCLTAINNQPGGNPIMALFKNGDDLRQDILTLQIIYIMDKIWLDNDLDLAMTPYKVLGTDCEQGYLEFVGNCVTLAYIQYERSVFHTFSDDTIEKYIETHLKKNYKDWEKRLANARQVFIRSTAGYCVASYILGLGDRHPDNIMINIEEGNYLHIDFGHFLGNVKKKFGIKRERDPFVFSKEIAYFINGGPLTKKQSKIRIKQTFTEEEHLDMSQQLMTLEDEDGLNESKDSEIDESMKSRQFKEFEEKCCQAYNILRKEGHQLINMFLIMLSAGMPELKKDEDIQFMVNRLDLNISEQEASNKFKKEIQKAMQTYSRRFDNFIHNIKAKFGK